MNLKLKRIAITILGILLTLSIAMSLAFYTNTSKMSVSADSISKDDIADSSYVINQRETFPASITVDYQGSQVVADRGVIIFPNGTTYTISENQIFVLDVIGEYTLKYFYEDTTIYDKFLVTDKLYSLSDISSGNSVSPKLREDMGDEYYCNLKSDVTTAMGTYGHWTNPSKGSVGRSEYADGLIVRMKQGVKFTYAEPIDLSEESEDGLTNVMSFSLKTSEFYDDNGYRYDQAGALINKKKVIMGTTLITLTDCYDPSIFMQILLLDGDTLYARVSTCDTSSQAVWVADFWDRTDAKCREVFYGSERSVVFTNIYGRDMGGNTAVKGYQSKVHLRYDNNEKIMYWGQEGAADIRGGTTAYQDTKRIGHSLIMDVDAPELTGGPVFRGFTTGEVYVSVQFTDAKVNESGRMDIYSIGNKNARDIILASQDYTDTKAPKIDIQSNATVNGGVYAKVGEKFTIPSAKATDINLKGDVSVNVYRGYGTGSACAVNVENGKFIVDKEDIYYVVYTATDFYGNVAEEVYKVYGISKDIITFDDSVRVADNTPIMTETLFPLGEKIKTLNNSADLKLKIELISDNETIVIADLKNSQEIDEFWANDNYFKVSYAGKYKVRLTYSDNAISGSSEYEFTTIASQVITFDAKPFIPRLLIKDAFYDFETVNAIKYSNGLPEDAGKAVLQISWDGGAFEDIPNYKVVQVEGSQTAQLKACFGEYSILSDVAIIKDVNFAAAVQNGGSGLNGVNYFHFEEGTMTMADDKDLLFVSNSTGAVKTLQFANMVNITNFSFTYRILDEYSNFDNVKFILSDPYVEENVLELMLYKRSGSVYFSYNGVEVAINEGFAANSDKTFEYNAASGVLSFTGATSTYAPEVEFSTPLAYFDIVLEGVRGNAGILVKKLNGQSLSQSTRDKREPDLVSDFMIGHYGVGEVITLPGVMFIDVLSPIKYTDITTSLKFDKKEIQTSIDGVLLDGIQNESNRSYQVEIKKIGEYRYHFKAVDAFGNDNDSFMIINAVDKVAPTIKFKGEIKENVIVNIKVGKSIKLNYTISDNLTKTENLITTIVLRDCTDAILFPINSKTIKFDKVGRFEVSIVCQDLANNVSIKSFEVVVSE